MKITFLGAAKTVTGSNFLVEGAGKKFIVDCGMYQGKAAQEMENSEEFLLKSNPLGANSLFNTLIRSSPFQI